MKHVRSRDVSVRRDRTPQNDVVREDFCPPTLSRSRANHGHPQARIAMAGGVTMPVHAGVDREPKRPAICVLMPDLEAGAPPPGVFGMYPAALIPKLLPWLRCERSRILHVCSGGLPPGEGVRVDIRPEAKPDIIADGRSMPLADASVDAVLIDPPYSEHYARELYGTEYPRPSHLLREAARVVKPCGRIGIVHYIVPNPPDGTVFVTSFGLSMGFGYPMRAITFYERTQPALFAGEAPPPNGRQSRRRRKVGAS